MSKPAPCKWCGSKSPKLRQPFKEEGSAAWRVECSCGAYGWARNSSAQAIRAWSGDEKGNGYNQLKT